MSFSAVGDGLSSTATAISEALVSRLASFPGIRVLGRATSHSGDASETRSSSDLIGWLDAQLPRQTQNPS